MVLFQIKDSQRCKATMEVTDRYLIVAEERCELPAEHRGMHRAGRYQWLTKDKLQRFMEERGESL